MTDVPPAPSAKPTTSGAIRTTSPSATESESTISMSVPSSMSPAITSEAPSRFAETVREPNGASEPLQSTVHVTESPPSERYKLGIVAIAASANDVERSQSAAGLRHATKRRANPFPIDEPLPLESTTRFSNARGARSASGASCRNTGLSTATTDTTPPRYASAASAADPADGR